MKNDRIMLLDNYVYQLPIVYVQLNHRKQCFIFIIMYYIVKKKEKKKKHYHITNYEWNHTWKEFVTNTL